MQEQLTQKQMPKHWVASIKFFIPYIVMFELMLYIIEYLLDNV